MISAKTDRTGETRIEIDGRKLLLLGELVAVVDCVSRTIFKDAEKDRVEFLKDLPEQLKKMIEEGGK